MPRAEPGPRPPGTPGTLRAWAQRLAVPLSIAALAGGFAADLTRAVDVTAPLFYLLPIVLGLVSPWRHHIVVAGVASGVVSVIGWATRAAETGGVTHRLVDVSMLFIGTVVAELARQGGVRLARERDALRRSQRELEELRWAMDESLMVAVLDADGVIVSVNDLFCRVLGRPREACVGRPVTSLDEELPTPAHLEAARRELRAGRPWRGEARTRRGDGEVLWLDVTVVPLLDERERVRGYLTLRADVTARKVEQALAAERATLARLAEMAAAVAHEVQNPVTGLDGALRVVGARLPSEAPERQLIAHMRERLQVLGEAVEDVLAFARPRAIAPRPTTLRELLARTVALASRESQAARVEIVDAGDAPFDADLEQLARALAGLVKNAVQAAADGGLVVVSGGRSGDAIVVTVTDDGPGLAPEVAARAFEPFFTTRAQGMGLGLPLARRAIEAHGGTLALERPSSGGTVARVRLPLSRARALHDPRP